MREATLQSAVIRVYGRGMKRKLVLAAAVLAALT